MKKIHKENIINHNKKGEIELYQNKTAKLYSDRFVKNKQKEKI